MKNKKPKVDKQPIKPWAKRNCNGKSYNTARF